MTNHCLYTQESHFNNLVLVVGEKIWLFAAEVECITPTTVDLLVAEERLHLLLVRLERALTVVPREVLAALARRHDLAAELRQACARVRRGSIIGVQAGRRGATHWRSCGP